VVGFTAGIPKIPLNLPLLKTCQIVGVYLGRRSRSQQPQKSRANVRAIVALFTRSRQDQAATCRRPYPLATGHRDAIAALAAREAARQGGRDDWLIGEGVNAGNAAAFAYSDFI
jgi:NADPH2:quinone reductase